MDINEHLKSEEAKKQFRALAKKFHSDLGSANDEIMKKINAAKDAENGDLMIDRLYYKYFKDTDFVPKKDPEEKTFRSKMWDDSRFSSYSDVERPSRPRSPDKRSQEEAMHIIQSEVDHHFHEYKDNIVLTSIPYINDTYTVFIVYRLNSERSIQQRVGSVNFNLILDSQKTKGEKYDHEIEKVLSRIDVCIDQANQEEYSKKRYR